MEVSCKGAFILKNIPKYDYRFGTVVPMEGFFVRSSNTKHSGFYKEKFLTG